VKKTRRLRLQRLRYITQGLYTQYVWEVNIEYVELWLDELDRTHTNKSLPHLSYWQKEVLN